MGRVAGAVAEFDRLLTAQQRVLGADHPDTRNNLAFCRGEGGMSPMIRLFDEKRERERNVTHLFAGQSAPAQR